jgi:hypothetical protein
LLKQGWGFGPHFPFPSFLLFQISHFCHGDKIGKSI